MRWGVRTAPRQESRKRRARLPGAPVALGGTLQREIRTATVKAMRFSNRSIPHTARLPCLLAAVAVLAWPEPLFPQPDTPLIDTRSSSPATNLDREALQNVPSARDPWSALSGVAPGVSPGRAGSISDGTTGSALMTIDGITVGNPADLGNSQTYMNFDAIEEVQVLTGGYGPEYGGNAIQGVIRVVTKAGTKEWTGTGQALGGSGDASVQAFANGRFEVMLQEGDDGGYCMQGFQFSNGGAPGAGSTGTLSIGFDQGFSIGVDASSQTPVSPGKTFMIEPCPGAETGMSFVDTPTPVTPPTPTHLYFGQNGVFAVDMNRLAALYNQDPRVFDRSYFLNGPATFTKEGFQQVPGVGAQPAAGSGNGLFLYGVDVGDQPFAAGGALAGGGFAWNPYGVQLQGGTPALPDADGDGKGDSYLIQFSGLQSACPNALGGAFTAEPGGTAGAGGYLAADAGAARPDCDYLKDWGSLSRDFQLGSGLRYDFQGGGRAEVFGAGDGAATVRTGGAFRTSFQGNDLGGRILRNKVWFWGSYGAPDVDPTERKPPLFSSGYYEGVNLAQWYADQIHTPAAVRSAPAGRGVQDVGLELRLGDNPDGVPVDYTPGGTADDLEGPGRPSQGRSANSNSMDAPLFYVVAQGGATGEVFQVEIVQPASGPVAIDGLVALEPVAATAEDRKRFEQELERAGGQRQTLTAAGYCLQMDSLAPPAGTVFRVAPAEKQARYAPMRRVLDAARRLREAGRLHPDSDPQGYYHSIRQWAAWTVEKGFDREGFLDAFLERTEENFRDAGQPWSEDVAAAVRSYGEGRWTDIRAILDAAQTTP